MDKRSDDPRKTPLEHIKDAHAMKRTEILMNAFDEVEWSDEIAPEQVGLRQVWADDNGSLWVIMRDGDRLKLRCLSGN